MFRNDPRSSHRPSLEPGQFRPKAPRGAIDDEKLPPAPKKKRLPGRRGDQARAVQGLRVLRREFCPLDALELDKGYNAKGYHPPYFAKPEVCNGCDMCGLSAPTSPSSGTARSSKRRERGPTMSNAESPEFSPAVTTSTATTPAARAPSPQAAASPPAIPSRRRPRSSSGSRSASRSAAAASSSSRTSSPRRSRSRARPGAARDDHRHLGPGLLAHDGAHRPRRHHRDALRLRERAARRAVHRPPDAAGAGRHDAGAVRLARRLPPHHVCPNSPQESFDLTVEAFNLAEEYRVRSS